MASPTPLHLDTDIGDDIDDALALALILGSPELELRAISTVYGNVAARGRQARTMLELAGGARRAIPVADGCAATLTPGLPARIDETTQSSTSFADDQLPAADPRHGAVLLAESLAADPTIVPVTIGPLTNMAVALTLRPEIATQVPRLVAMAGEFRLPQVEYNIICDPVAAALVFASGWPVDFITWSAGRASLFAPEHIARFGASNRPTAQYLAATIARWQGGETRAPALFDPLAVAVLLNPELIEWRRGRVAVVLEPGERYGRTVFTEDADGPHRVSWDVDGPAAVEFCLERMLRV